MIGNETDLRGFPVFWICECGDFEGSIQVIFILLCRRWVEMLILMIQCILHDQRVNLFR